MYFPILAIHSLLRWLVLLSLLFALYRSYAGWLGKKPFTKADNMARMLVATFSHIQLVLGLSLYFISPLINYFLSHFKTAVHDRQIRFFGMEHSLMMLLAIVAITIGAAKAKRKPADAQKFKTMAIWFTIALLILLSSIPWPFSPLVARPWLRF